MNRNLKSDNKQLSQPILTNDNSKVRVVLEQSYADKLSPAKIAREVSKDMRLVKKYAG